MIYLNGTKILDESDKQPNWNLLTGTKDFSGNWKLLSKTSDSYEDFTIAKYENTAWNGTSQYVKVTPGIYTFSLYAHYLNDFNGAVHFYTALNEPTETLPNGSVVSKAEVDMSLESCTFPITSDWQRYAYTSVVKTSGWIKPRIESDTKRNQIEIAGFKLERGSIATPWMPAIADLQLKSQNGGYGNQLNH